MIELFTNISEVEKLLSQIVVDNAFTLNSIPKIINAIEKYKQHCSPAVQEFVDFYVQLKLEERKDEEDNLNQR